MPEDTEVLELEPTAEDSGEAAPDAEPTVDAETGTPEGQAETQSEPDTLTRAQADEQLAAARSEWETQAEAKRQEAEDAARAETYQRVQTQSRRERQGALYQDLVGMAAWVAGEVEKEGKDGALKRLNPQVVGNLAQRLEAMVFQEQHDLYTQQFTKQLAEMKFNVPPDLQAKIDRAARTYQPDKMVETYLEVLEAAVTSKVSPGLTEKLKAELESAQKTKALKSAADQRAGQPRPTSDLSPGRVRHTYTPQQIEDMPMREWDALPDKERARILEEAPR